MQILFFSSCVESRAYCDQYRDIDEDTKLSTKHINREVSILPLGMHNGGVKLEREEFNIDIRLDAIWLVIFTGLLQPDTIQEEVVI